MNRPRTTAFLTLAAALLAVAPTRSGEADVPYPEGYRSWAHVKTGVVTAQSPSFAVAGGFHHIYANPPALEGYRTGNFADGAVLVFDRIAIAENGGALAEGQRIVVDVMVKNAARYAATGGWGFEEFAGSSTTQRNVGTAAKVTCFDCHARLNAGSSVVSKLRD